MPQAKKKTTPAKAPKTKRTPVKSTKQSNTSTPRRSVRNASDEIENSTNGNAIQENESARVSSDEEDSDSDANDPYSLDVSKPLESLNININVNGKSQKNEAVQVEDKYELLEPTGEEESTIQEIYSQPSALYPNRGVEVCKAIENFELSQELFIGGWRVDQDLVKKRSVLQYYGICVTRDSEMGTKKWICLASPECRRDYCKEKSWFTLTLNTSSGSRHLRDQHQIVAYKTALEEERRSQVDESYQYLARSNLYRNNLNRFIRLLFTQLIVNLNLPFCTVTKPDMRTIFALACYDDLKEDFSVPAIMHLLVEMYSHVHQKIVYRFRVRVEVSNIGFISLNVDIWMVISTGKKYVGLRAYFYNENLEFESRLLSIREFNPSWAIRTSNRLGKLVGVWVDAVCDDFEIKEEHVFASTTDGGSDIKWWAQNMPNALWEHCPPHLMARGVNECIGFESKDSSTSFESTAVIQSVKESITKIKETTKLGTLFEELNKDAGIKRTLQVFRPHRMMGVYSFLKHYVECYRSVSEFHKRLDGNFPLGGKLELLHQFTSILHPIAELSTIMQGSRRPFGWYYILRMNEMRANGGELCPSTPVTRFDDTMEVYDGPLCPEAFEVRKRLIAALDSRHFVKRYVNMDCDFAFELQLKWHPAYKNYDYRPMLWQVMQSEAKRNGSPMVTQCDVDMQDSKIQDAIHEKAKEILIRIYQAKKKSETAISKSGPSTSGKKTRSLLISAASVKKKKFASNDVLKVNRDVHESLKAYMSSDIELGYDSISEEEMQHLLEDPISSYWASQGKEFELMREAAFSIFSIPPSACPLELDFCKSGPMTSGYRTNFKPQTIERARVLAGNKDLVDLPQVCELSSSIAAKCPPTSPMVALELFSENITESNDLGDYIVENFCMDEEE